MLTPLLTRMLLSTESDATKLLPLTFMNDRAKRRHL